MIYLGNGLYSDSGNSLMHAGQRRKLGIDWNNPAQVREYYKEYYAMRNKGNGQIPSYNVPYANRAVAIGNAARNASNTASRLLEGVQIARRDTRIGRNGEEYYISDKNGNRKRPSTHDFSEIRRRNGIPLARRPEGNLVEQRSPRGGFVAPRHNADKIAAGKNVADTASRFARNAPKWVAVNAVMNDPWLHPDNKPVRQEFDNKHHDAKRGPGPKPVFANKETQQEQLNKRMHDDSKKAFSNAYYGQLKRQQGTLYEAVSGGGLERRNGGLYDAKSAKEAARRTTNSAQPGVEAGRKRVAEQQRKQREYENGVKAGRERARNARNAKKGVESKSAHNQAVKGQENRGSGTLADFNYQKKMDNNEKRKVADYKRGNKNSYFDLDLGKRNTERGIAAGRNRAKLKQAEDAFNKKLAADKQAKKDKQRETASMPYKAFKEGSERIVGSAYDAYKKGKKKLKKFFG